MINKYIKELLNEHNRVIVPDLGAFLYKGETSRTMYFNEFLRFNDGLLLNYMADEEKIDKIEAAKQIKAYVEETNKNLQVKKKVVIEGIGYLYLDENDKIQLQSESTTGSTIEETERRPSFTLDEPVASKPVELIAIPEKKVEETQPQIISPPSQITERKEETTKQVIQTSPATQVKTAAPAQVKKNTPPPMAKNNRVIIWIASIGVLIIISLLYLFIIKPLYQGESGNKKAIVSNANLDTIVNTQPKADSTQNNIQSVTAIPSAKPEHRKFYLVAGCFVQENNADKLVQKLKKEGFSPEKFAKIEHMYFVSIASFSNKASAEKQLQELKSKGYTSIWIKHY